jgi:hypothetical protein
MIKFKQGILGATSQAHTFFIMSGMYICQYRLASQCLITEETRCKCVFTVRMSSCCSLSLAELLPGSQITEKLNSAKGAFSAPKEKIESRKGYGYICVLTWGECWRPISKLTTHTYRNHALCITRKRGCPPSTTILSSSICYLSKNCATEIVLLFDQQMPTSMLKFAPAHCAEWCFTTLCRLAKLGWYGRTIQILPWRFLTLWASQLLECLATGCQSLTRCSTKADSLQHSLQHHIAGGRGGGGAAISLAGHISTFIYLRELSKALLHTRKWQALWQANGKWRAKCTSFNGLWQCWANSIKRQQKHFLPHQYVRLWPRYGLITYLSDKSHLADIAIVTASVFEIWVLPLTLAVEEPMHFKLD